MRRDNRAMSVLLWLAAIAMIAVGVIGTVLPALPGAVLVFGGVALAAWIDDFTRIGAVTLAVLGALTVVAWATDFVAAAAGARKVGASWLAIAGATIGTVAGVFTGFVGLLFLPLAGAAIGEYVAQRDLVRAGRVGIATWLGLVIGTAVKVAIVFTMLGVFVAALLI
jgi:uncharacterized protein YqgC (DUF456 family)